MAYRLLIEMLICLLIANQLLEPAKNGRKPLRYHALLPRHTCLLAAGYQYFSPLSRGCAARLTASRLYQGSLGLAYQPALKSW